MDDGVHVMILNCGYIKIQICTLKIGNISPEGEKRKTIKFKKINDVKDRMKATHTKKTYFKLSASHKNRQTQGNTQGNTQVNQNQTKTCTSSLMKKKRM